MSPAPATRFGRRTALACAAALLVAGHAVTARQAPAASLTLQEATDRALAANKSIAAARLGRPVRQAGVRVAGERPNPDLTFEAAKDAPKEALGVTLPIELGGKRHNRISLAEATLSTDEAEVERLVTEVRAEVRRAYFQAVAADARVSLAEDSRALATRARDAAQARKAAGEVPQSDVVQTALALVAAANEVTAAHGEATAARAQLNVLLGQPPDTPIATTDPLTGGTVQALADVLAQADRVNTQLAVLDRRIAEQTARRDLAKALQTPDLLAGTSFTYNALPDFRYGWRLTLAMTLPLFTRHRAGVDLETAELARLRADREAFAAQVAGDVAAAHARASAANEQVLRFQREGQPLLDDAERMAQASYSLGQTGLAALLQSLQLTREIRRQSLQASLDYQLALADLQRAIGAPIIR